MKFDSTIGKAPIASLKEAIFQGVAPDGGLYLPVSVPQVSQTFLQHLSPSSNNQELYESLAELYFAEDLSQDTIKEIVKRACNYPIPLIPISPTTYSLELFHGPTLSFKDFGARFMAQLVSHLLGPKEKMLILVATSGDTGSAVADAFFGIPNIQVCIFYAKGQVSRIQEMQLTTFGNNITAFEVDGSFDDCQAIVRMAVDDKKLKSNVIVSTANSINVARLIPQSFYFFTAFAQCKEKKLPLTISIPSGNFGHLMSGLLAKKMGLPINHFVAATNINDEVPQFLKSGRFEPHPSLHTLSHSMDVGNPSNFSRLWKFFHHNLSEMQQEIDAVSFTDLDTEKAIKEVYEREGLVLDPHSAIGYLGLRQYMERHPNAIGMFLATAHPAKFASVVEKIIGKKIVMPVELTTFLNKKKSAIQISSQYQEVQKKLLDL